MEPREAPESWAAPRGRMLPLARASGAARATERFACANRLLRARCASRRSTAIVPEAAGRRGANRSRSVLRPAGRQTRDEANLGIAISQTVTFVKKCHWYGDEASRRRSELRLQTDAHALSVKVRGFVEPLRIGRARARRIFLEELALYQVAIDLVGGPHHVAHVEEVIAHRERERRRDVVAQLDLRLRDNRKFVRRGYARILWRCEYAVISARREKVDGLVVAVNIDRFMVHAERERLRRFDREPSVRAVRTQTEQAAEELIACVEIVVGVSGLAGKE